MKIKELADLVGTTPRTIRHYHHEGLLPIPHNPGVRNYSLNHAVRLVRIRHLTESGLSLGSIREMVRDPDLNLDDELALAAEGIDRQIAELEEQRARLRRLRDKRGSGDPQDPLPFTVPERLAWFYDQIEPRLSEEARPYFDTERRALEVAVMIPFSARLIDGWMSEFTPERLDATVETYHFFARLPEIPYAEVGRECEDALSHFRSTFGPDWGISGKDWGNLVRPILMAPGVLTLLTGAYRHPHQRTFIRLFLEEVAALMEGEVSRETPGH